jgi:hypothetical protein
MGEGRAGAERRAAVTGRDTVLCAVSAGTVAAVALAVTEGARMLRGKTAWWDIILVSFAGYFGLLSVLGWGWYAVTAVGWTPVLAFLGGAAVFAVLVLVLRALERDRDEPEQQREEGEEP